MGGKGIIKPDVFKRELMERPLSDMVQEYLFDGSPFCFVENPELYWSFRQTICDEFGIHPQDFAIVGSAKLGFSVAPDRLGRTFSDSSDIDIVLVSDALFEHLWMELSEFKQTTLYRLNREIRDRFRDMQIRLFYGVIRFDKLSDDFPLAKKWWEFFNHISTDKRFGPRRVRAAFFKGWRHVSRYYEEGFRKLRQSYESSSIQSDNRLV